METRDSGWFRVDPSTEDENFFPAAPQGQKPVETEVMPEEMSQGTQERSALVADPEPLQANVESTPEVEAAPAREPVPVEARTPPRPQAAPMPPVPEATPVPGLETTAMPPSLPKETLPLPAPPPVLIPSLSNDGQAGLAPPAVDTSSPSQQDVPADPAPLPVATPRSADPEPLEPRASTLVELMRAGGDRVVSSCDQAAVLILTATPQTVRLGQVVSLREGRNMIGRNRRCKCVLDDNTVADYHSVITCEEENGSAAFYLYPVSGYVLGVNGTPVENRVLLSSGDRIALGRSEMVFFQAALRGE